VKKNSSLRPSLVFGTFLLLILIPLLSGSMALAAGKEEDQSPLNAGNIAGLALRNIGPALTSGRIADVVKDPEDPGTWYVAVGSGGVWKTVNAGTTWQPIFDSQGSYSIGCLTIDPSDHNTLWVGTGENVGGRHVGFGDGVYRSKDGGRTWENTGLKESEHIGNIVVHPTDPNTVYVAAQGPLWSGGGQRGLYRTTDGGASWEKVLGGGEYTGVNEVRMDPRDPRVLYAATHQRYRNVAAVVNGGPESGIHKSTDGGTTWREMATGLPEEDMGKIGLAISPQDPDVVYAAIELAGRQGAFYRSADGGESWQKQSDKRSRGTGPHYYQEIFASPHAFDRVYFMDVQLAVTEDGGKSWRVLASKDKHVDNHAMAFDPADPDYFLVGTDGGIYQTWDLGQSYQYTSNLPVTQFYKVAVDYDEPFYHIMGGTQDNNTQYGPSRTDHVHGITNADWRVTLFGDGHQPAIDPTNPDIYYCSLQQCNMYRVDRPTGEFISIKPVPGKGEPKDRWNWDGPILISSHDPARLYMASQRLWRSDDRGDSWRPLSGDLTLGVDRLLQPMMDRVQSVDGMWDLVAMSEYGTITSLAESPLDENLIYVGTDDGLIHATTDGGVSWRQCKRPGGVPEGFYVNHLLADRFDRQTVYAALDNHKTGDFAPYLFKSTNAGKSWQKIVGDLPDRHLVWRLAQDTRQPDLLFAATEFGMFTTVDGGRRWLKLAGAPTIPFRDVVIQERENDLVCASFGRGIFVLDDYTPLRSISEESLAREALLFTPRAAHRFMPKAVLGWEARGSQGAALYTAPNPPHGAVFTYYLAEGLQTARQARQEEEKELAAEGKDTPSPGWEALRREDQEDEPAILLRVRDEAGNLIRTVTGPVAAGLHRVAWDLRYPSNAAETDGLPDPEDGGMMVLAGDFTVELARRVDGVTTELAGPIPFAVVPLREPGLAGMDRSELAAYLKQAGEVQREMEAAGALLDQTVERATAVRVALDRAGLGGDAMYTATNLLQKRLDDLKIQLRGEGRLRLLKAGGPISIQERLGMGLAAGRNASYGPTLQQVQQLEIGLEEFAAWKVTLEELVKEDLRALEKKLDEAQVPWTSGRGY
jgi:photosystem II stability/assembly factor-like uncharacterized protein